MLQGADQVQIHYTSHTYTEKDMRSYVPLVWAAVFAVMLIGWESQTEAGAQTSYGKSGSVLDEPIKYKELIDRKLGMVQARSPIPESWQVHDDNDPIQMSSAQGVQIHKTQTYQFAWSPDPFMQQTIQMSRQELVAPQSLQQILDEQIKPGAASQGYRFLGTFQLPGVVGLWERLFAALPNMGNVHDVQALAGEWEPPNSDRSLILMLITTTQTAQSMIWQLHTTEWDAPAAHYEAAKAAYMQSTIRRLIRNGSPLPIRS